jgi:hypothetical protein
MRNRNLTKLGNVSWNTCMALTLASFAGIGCDAGNNSVDSTTEAVRAASPACATARDACNATVQPIGAGIETACAPVEAACSHRGGSGGASGTSGDPCSTARAACDAAIKAERPALQAAAATCEGSIHSACIVPIADAGSPFDHGGHDRDGAVSGGSSHDGDAGADRGHPKESAACETAESACQQTLASLRTMPPAACATISAACSGQTPSTVTDPCKTAISDCHTQLEAAATSAHQDCGSGIIAACSSHGG